MDAMKAAILCTGPWHVLRSAEAFDAGVFATLADPLDITPCKDDGEGHEHVAAHHNSEHFGSRLVLDRRDESTDGPVGICAVRRSDCAWEGCRLARTDFVFVTAEFQHRIVISRVGLFGGHIDTAGVRHADLVQSIDQLCKPRVNWLMKDSDALLLICTNPLRCRFPGNLQGSRATGAAS